LQKQLGSSKSGSEKVSRYVYEDQLSFLRKTVELRPTSSSIQPDDNNTQDLSQEESNNVNINTSENTNDALESGSDVIEHERSTSP
jgi:hypothetical protein